MSSFDTSTLFKGTVTPTPIGASRALQELTQMQGLNMGFNFASMGIQSIGGIVTMLINAARMSGEIAFKKEMAGLQTATQSEIVDDIQMPLEDIKEVQHGELLKAREKRVQAEGDLAVVKNNNKNAEKLWKLQKLDHTPLDQQLGAKSLRRNYPRGNPAHV